MRWGQLLAGAPTGHLVRPSKAIRQSIDEAQWWLSEGYIDRHTAVLDVGSGNGRQAIGLLEAGVARYVGLEVIPACVAYCTATFDDSRCEFVHLDVRNDMYNVAGRFAPDQVEFPFEAQQFDFVVAGSLFTHLEHLAAARRYADEICRVMRPGAYAYLSWFVSPPNQVSSHAKRTVFLRSDVDALLVERFETVRVSGGDSGRYHDQLQVVVRRR